ncbi:MAG: CPBP family intramembrane metalloprotease [Leptolyngbya sp. UWPOB_LEPTO1]|uniref:CPBP family intramembrane glutamic endopeptidase n=1 Tax=Leptolyngbya sp. UWPOB_LEPTO1 TaxID=2815653 RepID=UPI001ACB75BA|nr:type II CAAX endopeptidase family protein [Leptolyngbya sp. UWPOB_LEPTO1]MBN8564566.1 CPBP family intramembrane metalloprotease [Leptolyngbya sp. UWPOB_LEPTO1]
MNLNSFSKPQIAIVAAVLYTAIMGIGMFYMKTFMGITYGQPEMMNLLWFILILLNIVNIFWVTRYFSWQAIGFRRLNRQQLLWFLPLIAVLIATWVVFLSGLARVSLSAAQWQSFALVGFTTLLVGFGEEIMYRGIVLHAFLTTGRVRWAMLVSAIAFALLHAVNVFGGVPLLAVPIQLLNTFQFGFFFAPLMLKLNNILPLIIFHWLWDFVQIVAPSLVDEQTATAMRSIVQLSDPIELIGGIVMWLQIKQVPERAIADLPKPVNL